MLLDELIWSERPVNRRHARLDLNQTHGILTENHTSYTLDPSLPSDQVITVELKVF